jgi:DNA-binding NarL/FixJ family response regulator
MTLTSHQLTLCRLVADGWTDEAIGVLLEIKVQTVKNSLRDIRNRVHARNRAHLAAMWARGEVK